MVLKIVAGILGLIVGIIAIVTLDEAIKEKGAMKILKAVCAVTGVFLYSALAMSVLL